MSNLLSVLVSSKSSYLTLRSQVQILLGHGTDYSIPETAKTTMSQATYDNDAKKLWNKAPLNIKHSKSLKSAKKKREYVKTLPI